MSGDGGDVVITGGAGGWPAEDCKLPTVQERLKNVMVEALKEGLEPEDFKEIAKEALVEQVMGE